MYDQKDHVGSLFEAEIADCSLGVEHEATLLSSDEPRSYAAASVVSHSNWQKIRHGIADAMLYNQLPADASRAVMRICESSSCQSTCEVLAIGLMGDCLEHEIRVGLIASRCDENTNYLLQMPAAVSGRST